MMRPEWAGGGSNVYGTVELTGKTGSNGGSCVCIESRKLGYEAGCETERKTGYEAGCETGRKTDAAESRFWRWARFSERNESGNDPSVFDPLSGYKKPVVRTADSGEAAITEKQGLRHCVIRETGTGAGNVLCTGNRNTFPSAWIYDFWSSRRVKFPDWHRYH